METTRTTGGDVFTGKDSQFWAKQAGEILNGFRFRLQFLVFLPLLVIGLRDVLSGLNRYDALTRLGLIGIVAVILVGFLFLRRLDPAVQREAALALLTRCSDPTALRVLLQFVDRQHWTSAETARLTERHLPMARRAIEQGRGPLPKGLARWIGALREGGVVSEDLDEVARRIDASQGK